MLFGDGIHQRRCGSGIQVGTLVLRRFNRNVSEEMGYRLEAGGDVSRVSGNYQVSTETRYSVLNFKLKFKGLSLK
jgi:hypothetical protein